MSHHPETNPHFHPGTTNFHPQPPPKSRPKKQRPIQKYNPSSHFPINEPPHHPHPPPLTVTTPPFHPHSPPDQHPQPPLTASIPPFHQHGPPHQHPQPPPTATSPPFYPKGPPHHHPQPPLNAATHPPPPRPGRNQLTNNHNHDHSSLRVPSPHKTGPHTWLIGAFCALFWVAIILGGLIILVIYVVFRPRGPKFDISNASLNAAYLDMGYLLNADMTILANFTNPSKKATVDFSHIEIYLYYEKTLVASSYVNPFSALKVNSRFRDIHLVSSQVWLPSRERERLRQQINNNRVRFEVKVLLRTRSNLGTIFRYSYRLYGHCIIEVTGPPSGVLIAKQCKTRR